MLIFAVAILFVIFITINKVNNSSQIDLFKVVNVTDGDTITVEDKNKNIFKVRYIGIDTPESVKPNTPVQCYAKEASNFNKSLVLNKNVSLETDIEDKDIYGRLLRYVYLDLDNNGKYDDMVNEKLMTDGYAKVLTIAPNIKYSDIFKKEEIEAQKNNKGLWSACNEKTDTSAQPLINSITPLEGLDEHKEGCDIKGNISTNGQKIYHMKGQKYYDTTQIEPEKGEKWFCTEKDAQDNGYRKSKI